MGEPVRGVLQLEIGEAESAICEDFEPTGYTVTVEGVVAVELEGKHLLIVGVAAGETTLYLTVDGEPQPMPIRVHE